MATESFRAAVENQGVRTGADEPSVPAAQRAWHQVFAPLARPAGRPRLPFPSGTRAAILGRMTRSYARLLLVFGALLFAAAQVLLLGRILGDPAHGLLVPIGYGLFACGYCIQAGGYSIFVSKLPFQEAASVLRAAFVLFGTGSVAVTAGSVFFLVFDLRAQNTAAIIVAGILQIAAAAALSGGWLVWGLAARGEAGVELFGAAQGSVGAAS